MQPNWAGMVQNRNSLNLIKVSTISDEENTITYISTYSGLPPYLTPSLSMSSRTPLLDQCGQQFRTSGLWCNTSLRARYLCNMIIIERSAKMKYVPMQAMPTSGSLVAALWLGASWPPAPTSIRRLSASALYSAIPSTNLLSNPNVPEIASRIRTATVASSLPRFPASRQIWSLYATSNPIFAASSGVTIVSRTARARIPASLHALTSCVFPSSYSLTGH